MYLHRLSGDVWVIILWCRTGVATPEPRAHIRALQSGAIMRQPLSEGSVRELGSKDAAACWVGALALSVGERKGFSAMHKVNRQGLIHENICPIKDSQVFCEQ